MCSQLRRSQLRPWAVPAAALLFACLVAAPLSALPPTYDLTFPPGPLTIIEGGQININVTLVGTLCTPFGGVDWGTSASGTGATPAEPGDFQPAFPTVVGFSDVGLVVGVTVLTNHDADFDDETVTLQLDAIAPTISCDGQQPTFLDYSVDFTILDDDTPPTVEISPLFTAVTEGQAGDTTPVMATLTLTNPPPGIYNVSVDVQTFDQTATAGEDYGPISTTVFFSNSSPGPHQVAVQVIGDKKPEPDEEFWIKLLNPNGVALLPSHTLVVDIQNDDATPKVSVLDRDWLEGSGGGSPNAEITIEVADAPIGVPFSIDWHTEVGGAAPATPGVDYQASGGTVNFVPATNPALVQVLVPVVADNLVEGDETFLVKLTSATPGGLIAVDTATVTILDDDGNTLPLPTVSVADVALDEGDAGETIANFVVSLNGPSSGAVTFSWKTLDQTATAGSDYTARTPRLGVIPAGETSIELSVPVLGDNLVEADETFAIELSEVFGGTFARNIGVATIRNDDTEGEFSFSVGDISVREGDSGVTEATFTVTLSAARGVVPTVDFTTESGSATPGSDYQSLSGQLVFADGATSKTVTVGVLGDSVIEEDETFTLELSNATAGATIADASAICTITNDDGTAPLPTLRLEDVVVGEGNNGLTAATFVARLDMPAETAITATFETADGSATAADNDYQPTAGQIVFAPGVTEVQVVVQVVGDTKVETDESFGLHLLAVEGAAIGRGQASGLVRNDDQEAPPQVRSTIRLLRADPVIESAGFALVVVERVGEPVGSAQAVLSAFAGTATAGDDFTPTRETLAWADGVGGEREVRVPIVADNVLEGDETIRVLISEVRGAREGQPLSGEIRVVDDDSPMRLEIVGAAERDSRVGSELDLEVRALREDGSPVAGAVIDFAALNGPLRLVGEGVVRSNEEGVATQRVAVGPAPGLARVGARLRGTEAEASFLVRVAGNLGELDGGNAGGGGERTLGSTLDENCVDATGELAEACAYVYGLGDRNQQRQAVAELTPRAVAAQLRAALQGPKNQGRNVGARMDALRGGTPMQTLDQLSLSVAGQSLGGVGTLQQALLRGSVAPPAGDPSGRGDAEKLEQALSKARGAQPVLAKQDSQPASDPYDATESPWGMFVNGRLSFGDAPQRGQDPSYDFKTEGITAGVDYRLSSELVVGAAFGWLSTQTRLDLDGGRIDTTGYSLSLYSTWYRRQFYVEAVVGYGKNDYQFKRVINLPQPFRGQNSVVALGKPKSDQISADFGAGYEFRVGEALSLNGFGRFSYIDTSIDPYIEDGAGPFNLGFAEQSLKSLLGEAGVEATYPISVSWGVLQPLLRVSFLHEFEDDPQVIRARFLLDGQRRNFVLRSERPDSDYLNVAAGISATLPRGWAGFLQYDTDLAREELDVYTISGGFRFQF